jgi:hypothetical protein
MNKKEKIIKEQRCENCLYSREYGDFLSCRRDLPSLEITFSAYGHWPIVEDSKWCGEWESDE